MTLRSPFRLRVPLLVALPCALALSACGSTKSSNEFLGLITPYRIDVVQGNVVTREQAALAKPGMTRAQVRDTLGSPLLTDPFHADRWDYVFTIRRQGAVSQQRRIAAYFDGDVLQRIETGDQLPSEREFDDSIDTFKAARAPVLTLTQEQLKALPQPTAPAPAVAASAAPPRNYPPLEARQ